MPAGYMPIFLSLYLLPAALCTVLSVYTLGEWSKALAGQTPLKGLAYWHPVVALCLDDPVAPPRGIRTSEAIMFFVVIWTPIVNAVAVLFALGFWGLDSLRTPRTANQISA